MAFARFRLYYKINMFEKRPRSVDWKTKQDVELHRIIFPDFMDWYNDTFLQRNFTIYRDDEIPEFVEVKSHFASFDKELGIVFVLEYEVNLDKGTDDVSISESAYEKLTKLIQKVTKDSDENMDGYSDCVCYNAIPCSNGKAYWPKIEEFHSRVVIDVDPNHAHIKYGNVDLIENLHALKFNTEILCEDGVKRIKEKLEHDEEIVGHDDEFIKKLEDVGKLADTKKMKMLSSHIRTEIEELKFVLDNKDLYFLK